MKKLFKIALTVAMAFSIVGCSSSDSEEEAKTVGICVYQFDDNFMTTYRTELEEKLTALGYEVTVVDGSNDQSTQSEQIDTFIAQGVDALIINPVMTSAASEIVAKVQEADIPTVLINREPEADTYADYDKIAYVGCDASQSGTFEGEIILNTATSGDINGDGVISYIMLIGDPENSDSTLRTEYSVKALTDAGWEVECLYEWQCDWDQTKGQEATATALSKFPGEIEVVFSNNDAMALGAIEAIQAAGLTVGEDVYLVGVDALDDALDKMNDGLMTGTVLNDADTQSDMCIEVLELLLAGESVEKLYYCDYTMVTTDNIADYID